MPNVTYSRFLEVLRALGFRVDPTRSSDAYTSFDRGEGTLGFTLPAYSPDERVWSHHLSAVRSIFRHEDPDDSDRYEVLIRTHPRTWAITAENMVETYHPELRTEPANGEVAATQATLNGRRKPSRRAKAKKAPPAA